MSKYALFACLGVGAALACGVGSTQAGSAPLRRRAVDRSTIHVNEMTARAGAASSPASSLSTYAGGNRRVSGVDGRRASSDRPFTAISSLDRVFDVLNLFSVAKPLWTVDEATAALKHSRSTVYRYIRTLVKAGLLASVGRSYGLAPRIVQLHQQMRLTHPLLRFAHPQLAPLRRPLTGAVLLMRLFHDRITFIHKDC